MEPNAFAFLSLNVCQTAVSFWSGVSACAATGANAKSATAAIAVMKLIDEGKLDLTSDVSHWLGWSLRNPRFPDRPITLPMLLSHTASVREHDDDYVIPLGGSLQQVMADPANWDPQHGPGEG